MLRFRHSPIGSFSKTKDYNTCMMDFKTISNIEKNKIAHISIKTEEGKKDTLMALDF